MVLAAQEYLTSKLKLNTDASQSRSLYPIQLNPVQRKVQALWTALIILSIFFCVELSAGIWSNSLSLLADAEHILSDVVALGVALLAIWLSQSISQRTILKRY